MCYAGRDCPSRVGSVWSTHSVLSHVRREVENQAQAGEIRLRRRGRRKTQSHREAKTRLNLEYAVHIGCTAVVQQGLECGETRNSSHRDFGQIACHQSLY